MFGIRDTYRKVETNAEENQGYFVTDAAGQRVEVCFETLTADDIDVLNSDDWHRARFGEVWKEWAEHEIALKLVRCDSSDKSILGIVTVGFVRHVFGRTGSLKGNLLGTASIFRYNANERQYRGIGRVLVARLIIESKFQGAEGQLRVLPLKGSHRFYVQLGFVPTENKFHVLHTAKVEELLAEFRLLPQ